MSEFRFNTIETEPHFYTALDYLSRRVKELSIAVCDVEMSATILKLFAHSEEEFDFLKDLVEQQGDYSEISSENSFYVDIKNGLRVNDAPISLLGVRRPDANYPQVGCGDFEVSDFENFAAKILKEHPKYAQPVENAHGLDMIKLSHPSFDVLGYIVPS